MTNLYIARDEGGRIWLASTVFGAVVEVLCDVADEQEVYVTSMDRPGGMVDIYILDSDKSVIFEGTVYPHRIRF